MDAYKNEQYLSSSRKTNPNSQESSGTAMPFLEIMVVPSDNSGVVEADTRQTVGSILAAIGAAAAITENVDHMLSSGNNIQVLLSMQLPGEAGLGYIFLKTVPGSFQPEIFRIPISTESSQPAKQFMEIMLVPSNNLRVANAATRKTVGAMLATLGADDTKMKNVDNLLAAGSNLNVNRDTLFAGEPSLRILLKPITGTFPPQLFSIPLIPGLMVQPDPASAPSASTIVSGCPGCIFI